MLAISKISNEKNENLHGNLVSKITVLEVVSVFGIDEKVAYKQTKDAAENLMNRYIRLFNEQTGEGSKLRWVGQTNYQSNEGWVEVEFWHKIVPHLINLSGLFTTYKLSRASAFKSMYSWRLFELLMQFKKTGLLNIPINDFNHALETPDSLRANFANLRNRVIEPAVKEIRAKDGLAVEWEAIKAGRKVKALKFTFPMEKAEQPKAATKHPTLPDAELETIDKPMTKAEAKKAASQIIGKANAGTEIMPLNELQSRLDAAYSFVKLTGDPLDKYLTENDRKAIQHYNIKI